FALTNKNGGIGVFQQFRPAIRNTAHAVEVPNPAAIAIWPPLPKALWVVFQHLIKQVRIFIDVVRCQDAAALWLIAVFALHGRHQRGFDCPVRSAVTAITAVWFKGWQADLATHMIAADDRIIASKAVRQESVRCVTVELYA